MVLLGNTRVKFRLVGRRPRPKIVSRVNDLEKEMGKIKLNSSKIRLKCKKIDSCRIMLKLPNI